MKTTSIGRHLSISRRVSLILFWASGAPKGVAERQLAVEKDLAARESRARDRHDEPARVRPGRGSALAGGKGRDARSHAAITLMIEIDL